MVGTIKKKLNSTTGASLAVALLFFVFVAVIGSVILAAASSGMGRIKNEDHGNQERYALYSAANVVIGAFANQNAFSFQTNNTVTGITNNNDLSNHIYSTLITNQGTTTYYVNNETGNRFSDETMNASFNAGDVNSKATKGWPGITYTTTDAKDLSGIRNQIAEKVFQKYWNTIQYDWNENTDMYWSSLTEDAESSSVYRFQLTGEDSWADNAPAFKEVDVTLTVQDNLDIVGEFKVHKQNENNLSKQVTGEKYYIRIPFSSEAKIHYGLNGSTQRTYSENYTTVTEQRTIQLDHFQWEPKDQAVMSTRESEVE